MCFMCVFVLSKLLDSIHCYKVLIMAMYVVIRLLILFCPFHVYVFLHYKRLNIALHYICIYKYAKSDAKCCVCILKYVLLCEHIFVCAYTDLDCGRGLAELRHVIRISWVHFCNFLHLISACEEIWLPCGHVLCEFSLFESSSNFCSWSAALKHSEIKRVNYVVSVTWDMQIEVWLCTLFYTNWGVQGNYTNTAHKITSVLLMPLKRRGCKGY